MIPTPGTVYRFDSQKGKLSPVNAGVALPLGSVIYNRHKMTPLVVVSETVGAEGQRTIEQNEARFEIELSRSTIEAESYRYELAPGRLPLPEVCALIAKREEVIRAAAIARQDASRRADEAHRRGLELINTKRPPWAQAAIVARFEVDASQIETDYFATTTKRTVLLAWSKNTRDLFPELRKAAARFPETAHLATPPPIEGRQTYPPDEHREKWSMGAGYYLKAGHRYSTGWKVEKVCHLEWLASDIGENPEANYCAD